MRHNIMICCWLVATVVLLTVCISAAADETSAQPKTHRVGVSHEGLSGVRRVGMPYDVGPSVMLSGGVSYGYTESLGTVPGSHHRLAGTLGIGGRIWPFLGLALNVTGRYDMHPEDDEGKDTSIVGDPRLLLRGGYPVWNDLHLGAEVGVWVPGVDAPSLAWGATTVDTKLLAAFVPQGGRYAIAGYAGFRIDNSNNAAPALDRTRPGDRLTLGASDFHAVLLGLGASYDLSPFEIIGEFSWDILVGDGAPKASESPIRLSVGTRYYPIDHLGIELLCEVGLGSRPGLKLDDPLIPVEPRLSIVLGVSYTFDFSKKEVKSSEAEDDLSDSPGVEPRMRLVDFEGRVVDENGDPVAGAEVRLVGSNYEETRTTDEGGGYQFEDAPVGSVTLFIKGEGYEDLEQAVTIEPEVFEPHQSTLALSDEPVGSQLRGLVRAFNGKGVRAQIIVQPLGEKLKTDFEGHFELDVPPGTYKVTIKAKGYKTQKRKVTVEPNGVSIINVDLRYAR